MAPGVTQHMCVTLGMKFVSILAKGSQNISSKGCVCETDRQTDTGGMESQVSVVLGGLGQRSAPTWPQVLYLQHGVGVGMRLNSRGLSMFNILYQHRPAELSVMMELVCVVQCGGH